jgi:branched-chain amino acid transport system substrate-binding protein
VIRKKRFSVAFVFTTCILVALTLALGGCGNSGAGKTYKIGVILSLSGPSAPLGQSEQRSIQLLEKDLQKGDGINGGKVQFIIEDDESDPAKANVAVNKLIDQEGVAAIIGCSSTGSTLAIAPTVKKKQIPCVAMAAGTAVTQPTEKWLFSVAPSDVLVVQRVLMYFRDEAKVKNVAILHDSNAYGTGGADVFNAQAPKYGVKVVADESYGSADTDMTAQLTKITQTPAQAILVWGTNPGPASIAKNIQQLNIKIPFVASSGIANQKFIELAGSAANGVVFAASRLILPSTIPAGSDWEKAVNDFSSEYKAAYNISIDTFAAHGWDAGNMVVNAMKKAGTESTDIRDRIEQVKDYPGVDGVFTYSPTNHAGLKVNALIMVKIVNGQWTQDKPSGGSSK